MQSRQIGWRDRRHHRKESCVRTVSEDLISHNISSVPKLQDQVDVT